MSSSEGPAARARSPRASSSGLGRGRGKTNEFVGPGVRPAGGQKSPLRSDARTDAARVSFAETPPQARLPASAGESWQSQSSPSFEVQLSALSTKVAALEEAKDKVDALQASLKEVEKRSNFLQKANEVRSFSFF